MPPMKKPQGGHGGARQGSGRKRVRDVFERPIRRAEQQIADHLPALIENLLVLANGVTVEGTASTGGTTIYTRPPDRAANEYLINRLLGKPTEMAESEVSLSVDSITIRSITAVEPPKRRSDVADVEAAVRDVERAEAAADVASAVGVQV